MNRFAVLGTKSIARRSLPALLVGIVASLSTSAAAQTDTQDPEWMVFLAVHGDATASSDTGFPLTLRFAEMLAERHAGVVDPAAVSHTLSARHSVEPKELDSLQIRELRLRIDSATMNISLGDLRGAQRDLEQLGALRSSALDFLNREVELRQRALDGCLVIVRFLISGRRKDSALEQAIECRRTHPGVDPDPSFHPPDVRRVFAEASAHLQKLPPATLEVESAPRIGCTVRLNGIESGKTPLRIPRLRQGDIRVQVECDEHHGRVHNIRLEPGPNKLVVDTELDAALRGPEPFWLEYPSWKDLMSRAPAHTTSLARLVGIRNVLLITSSDDGLWVHRLDADSGDLVASVQITSDDPASLVPQTVETLLQKRSARIDAAGMHAGDVFPWRDPEAARAASDPRTEPPPSFSSSDAARTVDSRRTWGLTLAIFGGSTLAVSYGLWAWRHARAAELDGVRSTDPDYLTLAQGRENLRWPHLATAGLGAITATLAIPHLVDDVDSVPWWSWTLGGVGLAIAGTGIALWAAESDCQARQNSPRCVGQYITENIGPHLLMTAIPLLALPLFHLSKKRDGAPAVSATVEVSRGTTTATVFGSF